MSSRSVFCLWGISSELKGIRGLESIQDVLSDIGFSIFEICTVVGISLLLTFLFWKLLSRIGIKDPNKKIFKLITDIAVLWIILFVFEGLILLTEYFFAILIKGYPLPTSLNSINYSGYNVTINEIIDAIVKFSWIDMVLVIIFYTILGFGAFRKARQYKGLIPRISLDFIQGALILIEFFILLIPFGVFLTDLLNNLFLLLYWLFVGIIFVESLWMVNFQIEVEKQKSGKDHNLTMFMILLVGLYLSISFLLTALPQPFYLFFTNTLAYIFVLGLTFICLFCFVIIAYFLVLISIPNIIIEGRISNGAHNVRFKISSFLASKGTIFNYPSPINIIGDKDSSGAPIVSRLSKVTLKMACGRCYHVFTIQTESKGSKSRSFPCPFCGAMTTTPVWE